MPGAALIRSFENLRLLYVFYGLGFTVLSCLFAFLFSHMANAGEILGADAEGRKEAADAMSNWANAAFAGTVSITLTPFILLRLAPYLPGLGCWLVPAGMWLRASLSAEAKRRVAVK